VSYLAAEAKRNAKQSTSNISYISSQRDKILSERTPAISSASFRSQTFSISGLAWNGLPHLAEQGVLAEYEQQVY
jgi:hypothetical protein